MMRILVSTALLSPYRVDWLNELGKYAEVDILYLNEGNSERNREWLAKRPKNCSYKLMRGPTLPTIGKISKDLINKLEKPSKEYDILILDGYGYPTQLLNIGYLNRRRIPYFVNVDGAVPKDGESAIAKHFKRRIISRVPYFLCGSKATADILSGYGSSAERIIHHPFSSLYKDDIYSSIASASEKERLRSELGICEKQVVVSVGRFSYMNGYGKGYDALLRAAKVMPKSVGWYIVGGSPTDEFARMKADLLLDNVHFVDFKPKEELKKYYRAADLFVLMTVGDVWGLVVNEAMACGLPVITTTKCVAGVELVDCGCNGYIVEVGDDRALASRAMKILFTDGESTAMGDFSLKKISGYTIERMAETHMAFFKEILSEATWR